MALWKHICLPETKLRFHCEDRSNKRIFNGIAMPNLLEQLENLIEISMSACTSWLADDGEGGFRMIDPNDSKIVASHYGDSHLAAALLISGRRRNDGNLIARGLQVLRTVVRHWHTSLDAVDFHHDFNNFALCLALDHIGELDTDLTRKIKSLVLSTRDSNHDTINWLPMRAYVNLCRQEWSGEERYAIASQKVLEKVRSAVNSDGGIEDRLPFGTSYNTQYNVSSLAALQHLARRWPEAWQESKAHSEFLLNCQLPDGDINFMGRGANQIFAWGPWLYVLTRSGDTSALKEALDFLGPRYPLAASNFNILLNNFAGCEKSFWWDYHYCSVYHAHFLLWTVLALEDHTDMPGSANSGEIERMTGLSIMREKIGGASLFSGRSTYLAEAGSSICALWLSNKGMLFKGGLGPWQGLFGKKYSYADTVMQNHLGLLAQEAPEHLRHNRLWRKITRSNSEQRSAMLQPIFCKLSVRFESDKISLQYETPCPTSAYLNIPIFEDIATHVKIEIVVDGERQNCIEMGRSRNQYGWVTIFRSTIARGTDWMISVS